MKAEHIPFVFNEDDSKILTKYYSDSAMVRVSLETWPRVRNRMPHGIPLWMDGGVDGLHAWRPSNDNSYSDHIKRFPGFDRVADSAFQENPEKGLVRQFVQSLLDECHKSSSKSEWLSVPQLPIVAGAGRNKINRMLAEAANEWKVERRFNGKVILPIILLHQNQVNGKTNRKGPLDLAARCYDLAGSDGVWVAQSWLNDQEGAKPLERRFQDLIEFHQELNARLPSQAITVVGPHWGMNLVLWARGLARYAAVGLGNAYRYYIPGGMRFKGKDHIALPPLRRWVVASPQFKSWLHEKALPRLSRQQPTYAEFSELYSRYDKIVLDWRSQVADFQKRWFDELAGVQPSGRALALYQQLSSAYVLGRSLPELPKDEKSARKPERVAQQLMMSCL